MRNRSVRRSFFRLTLPLTTAICLLPTGTWAQQESSSYEPQQTQADDKQPGESSNVRPAAATTPEEPRIRQLGRAGSLLRSLSPLRWGPVYVASAEFLQVYRQFDAADPALARARSTSLFSTNVVLDHRFRRSRLVLQYEPRLTIVDGQVLTNFTNQNLKVDTYYLLTPRWTLGISDRCVFFNSSRFIGDQYLQTDGLTGSTAQNDFVDSAGRWLQNDFGLSFSYAFSARTQLVISPSYTYSYFSDSVSSATGRQYGSHSSLSHALSATRTIGVSYSVEKAEASIDSSARLYQTMGFTFTQRFGPTWWLTSSVVAVTDTHAPGARRWTMGGYLSLVKSLHRSTISLAYYRGQAFPGYVTSNISDRADAGYGLRLTKRMQASFGVGYSREVGALRGVYGKYALANTSYRLYPTVSLFAGYAHKMQTGDGFQVLTGNHDLFIMGVRWIPPEVAR